MCHPHHLWCYDSQSHKNNKRIQLYFSHALPLELFLLGSIGLNFPHLLYGVIPSSMPLQVEKAYLWCMVRRTKYAPLLRSFLALVLIGLFMGGSTASYCLTQLERGGHAAATGKADRIEKFTNHAFAGESLAQHHSLKLPVYLLLLFHHHRPVMPVRLGRPTASGYPIFGDSHRTIILLHYVVKNAP